MYAVKEMFFSIQGEGRNRGRYSVFCRFAGCNLWSGREKDREKAICNFCDTDFLGTDGINGKKYKSPNDLVNQALSIWRTSDKPFIVLTGGEPLLQLDDKLIEELHHKNFEIAVETNGTIKAPNNLDWICVSPKANTKLEQIKGDELKLVYPQENIHPKDYEKLEFQNFFLQPKFDKNYKKNVLAAKNFCIKNLKWKLSYQMHKFIGVP
jgi:7-carboxy-7-deazaguanine synthase (Cx14CxxC type)|tara:strand:+ start:2530 stop:3156 length:627 start_codon:yes stop_codon:yes gene_type:complete